MLKMEYILENDVEFTIFLFCSIVVATIIFSFILLGILVTCVYKVFLWIKSKKQKQSINGKKLDVRDIKENISLVTRLIFNLAVLFLCFKGNLFLHSNIKYYDYLTKDVSIEQYYNITEQKDYLLFTPKNKVAENNYVEKFFTNKNRNVSLKIVSKKKNKYFVKNGNDTYFVPKEFVSQR